jgi:hypothetical protein
MSWFAYFSGGSFVAMLLTVLSGDPGSNATLAKVGIIFAMLLFAGGIRLAQIARL